MKNRENAEISKHHEEIKRNLASWEKKPLLREIYLAFHQRIAAHLSRGLDSRSVELGSGIGNIQEAIPNCIRTDLFPNPWIDRVENAYQLSFADRSIDNLILFDVFHHLRYPGTALQEFRRVLVPGGRVLIFEPCLSVLGWVVYGPLHHEDLGLGQEIQPFAPEGWSADEDYYYAAQGNASRVFLGEKYQPLLKDWRVIARQRMSAISYVASGGYSKLQLYPDKALPLMKAVDRVCDLIPALFATRLLVVLEKSAPTEEGAELAP